MKRYVMITVGCFIILSVFCLKSVDAQTSSVIWDIDNLEEIGGHKTEVLGSPVVIETPMGRAVEFDGKDDAILLDTHPLAGFEEFTVEIIFRPDSGGLEEQRFFHMGTIHKDRVLIETRLVGNQWFFDTFIQSGEYKRTLYSEGFLHALGQWYHVALTYKENEMAHYVNGVKELSNKVNFTPVSDGKTSVGCRLNEVHWFKGAIRKVRFTSRALLPEDFMDHVLYSEQGGDQKTSLESGQEKIGNYGVLYRLEQARGSQEEPVTLSTEEQERRERAEQLDKEGLLYSSKVVVDSDPKMLIPPKSVFDFAGKGYSVAKTHPRVEFAVVPVEPKFFADPPEGNKIGFWSNFSQSIYNSRSGKFYSSVGDHGSYDVHLYIVEYDTRAKKVRCLPDIYKLLGRKKDQFSDAKIHGWLDFYQSKDLDRAYLWFCTYWAKYPEPNEEDYATGYEGGRIMSYDVGSGTVVDYGVPLLRASWPFHKVDTKRGILYAVSKFGEFLVWDINTQKTKWAGFLPKDMGWWVRTILIDDETGMVYSTNHVQTYLQKHSTVYDSKTPKHFIKYDPYKNRFYMLEVQVPRNSITGTYDPIGAYTYTCGPDGLFYAITFSGEMFTFDTKKEQVVDKGINWPGDERYTASVDRSPDGKYLYYVPGAVGSGYLNGSPVVQYNTKTGTRKVLAFMFPYYYDKYGYIPGGTFSIKLDDKGERLFIVWNGGFTETKGKKGLSMFRHCSVMVVDIPESERR